MAPLRVVRDDEIGHLTTAFNRLLGKLGEHQAELGRLAYHDSLTGLPNRKMLEDRLLQALAQARRHAKQVALLYLDLDGFKKINDTLGHDAGDEALKETARRLQAVVRQADTVVRLGGDEFIVLAGDFEEPTEVGSRALANKCIAAVGQPLQLRAAETTLGVSIGIALSNGRHSPDELLAAADAAMYQAKQQGRGGFVIARP
jgi:diguanylate cyclase (GGDEF)-like protein